MQTRWIIDPPGAFAPIAEWRDFADRMREILRDDDDPGVREALAEAERRIADA